MVTKKGGCFLIDRSTNKIAIVHRIVQNDYSFPKGHIEKGEDVKECAIRETIEETGNDVKLILEEPICINKYTTSSGEDVEVYMYLAESLGEYKGIIAEKDRELCEWVNLEDVDSLLSYDDLKGMWESVKEIIIELLNTKKDQSK
jgi:8-oxo-dGTP diphosphatase